MKKITGFSAIAAATLMITAVIPALASAQTESNATSASQPEQAPASIRERLRAEYPAKVEAIRANVESNRDYRNQVMEGRQPMPASSTTGARLDLREKMRNNASSTANRIENRVEAQLQIFKIEQDKLTKNLNTVISNLKQITDRIVSRIEKAEQSGRDMSEAKKALVIAQDKVVAAEKAVTEFAAFVPTASSTLRIKSADNSSTTVREDILRFNRPRDVGQKAIEAVKEAKKALNDVVTTIAHSMGTKNQ